MHRFAWAVVILAAAVGTSIRPAGQTPSAGRWQLTARPFRSPAGPHSAQPQLTSSKRGVLLSWIETSGARATLKFAEWRGGDWSAARSVASGTNWFVNWADVPSVFRLDDGTLVAHWLQKSGSGTYAYDVRLSRSNDDGATWSPSFLPHHDGTKTEHGFASLFQLPGSQGLGVVWLDGRATAGAQAGHGGHGAGNMALRYAAFDRTWRQTSESVVDPRVCECCPTAVATTSDGPVTAYRNRGTDETRDIYVSRLQNGQWSEPVAAHEDGWRINACPVNGPALSADGRRVALAWFTGRNDQPQAYASFSTDAARTFGKPVRLDDGASNGRVDIELLPDGSAAAMYIEYSNRRPRLNVRRIDASGQRSDAVTIATIEDGRGSGYARLARAGNELIFAWMTREETPRVRTAVARIALNK